MATLRSSPIATETSSPIKLVDHVPLPHQPFEDRIPDYTNLDGIFHALKSITRNSESETSDNLSINQRFDKIIKLLKSLREP